ncbi:MAG TPA: 6,7-dimethyl-8-ribityllumazine synthase [Salinisphaeraceae bacterium]|nr:6,7-dimethyl-8-ribityllumazine synthase [Salinisphaeraceae bacterium]
MRELQGSGEGEGLKIAVVSTRWNDGIVDRLVDGALDVLDECGVADEDITLVRVPGAFELPLACDQLASSEHYDAIVALGAVIRGETPHFDYVAGECARGVAQTALEYGVPIAFGVLTVDTIEQAEDRAQDDEDHNKGVEAASAAIEMATLLAAMD